MKVYTKQQRIAQLAKQSPQMGFKSLNHYLDMDWMKEAYRRTRKDGAVGVDGQTGAEYEIKLEGNLQRLIDRAKSGEYYAPPVRRAYISKGRGKEPRAIGVPTFENKVLERAVVMVLEPIYEQDFLDCSYGFRPGRSAHQALQVLWKQITEMGGCWIIDADISKCFDTMDHGHLREFIQRRVCDGVIGRLIGKWLKAGVMEESKLWYPEKGSPQGGVVSPILSNIYLHEVLDTWFEAEVKPRLKGRGFMLRFADDFVMGFQLEEDARRVLAVLAKRFARYGLAINLEKTRLVPFGPRGGKEETGSFDFLGFTHYWGKSRKGRPIVKRKTAKNRLARALKSIGQWCRSNRHAALSAQHQALTRKLRGHYGYYGITGNGARLKAFLQRVKRTWRYWLNRRSRNPDMSWDRFSELLAHYQLPTVKIVHSVYRTAKP